MTTPGAALTSVAPGEVVIELPSRLALLVSPGADHPEIFAASIGVDAHHSPIDDAGRADGTLMEICNRLLDSSGCPLQKRLIGQRARLGGVFGPKGHG
ncbi:Hypothetical protein CAP_1414 [Chondromyces apiculatus DSM 436]|uniref:Uncharacterized protein n=1 Tax=Chondromyces apiculatus DSM 436 TaxID=1192034 RepID=A0A017SSW3_9BACT|nr:Hypothetical protein CAP_1414 [Chondromyces apiculatus DSM 436]